MKNEIWAPYPDDTNIIVSDRGNVKTYYVKSGRGRIGGLRDLSLPDTGGYQVVSVNSRRYYVHRLVCETFISNPSNKRTLDVNHINGVKEDNRAENLEWSTRSENMRHAYSTGLAKRNPCSEETKRKISLANRGKSRKRRPQSEQTKLKLSLANIGKKHSEKTKNKISHASAGRKCSEQTKRKISLANTGRKCSEQTKRKLSIAQIEARRRKNADASCINKP